MRATASIGAAYATSTSIKLAVGRKRPAIEDLPHLMATPTGLSFPSSHTTSSFAAARAFGALVPGAPLQLAAAAMGLSRLYLGVHYPSDVAAGRRARPRDREPGPMMKVGLVGMPNAGKSSLFNALSQAGAEAANYPFTTIEPNVAVVPVKDERMEQVAATVKASNIVWDTIEFHDIAGLVAGASKGEGLGNKFLANIRECDALLHVVRTHTRRQRHPPGGLGRPGAGHRDDRDRAAARRPRHRRAPPLKVIRDARSGDRAAVAEEAWLRQIIEALQSGRPARTVPVPHDAPDALRNLSPLTGKPVLFVANVNEGEDAVPSVVADHAAATGAAAVAVSSRIEADLSDLGDDEEAALMREELGHRRLRPAPRRQRGLRPAAPDRVLHRGRGQARADLAPARRPHRLACGGPDPLGHPEGLRPRRGDRLGRARGRRRVRGRPRQGHAAPRGPRLPDERR